MQVAACFRLVSLLDSQQQQQEEDHAKRVPDGHGRSFGPLPWQKDQTMCFYLILSTKNTKEFLFKFIFGKLFFCIYVYKNQSLIKINQHFLKYVLIWVKNMII